MSDNGGYVLGAEEDAITCWVCFEIFTEPVSLYCGHSFCKECVIKVFKKNPICPFCRHAFGLPIPPVSASISRLVSRYHEKHQTQVSAAASSTQQALQSGTLFLLPLAAIQEILVRCGPGGLATLARTCRRMRELSEDPVVWRDLCRARWPFVTVDQHRNWKRCYQAHSGIQRGWEEGRAGDFHLRTFRGHANYIAAFQLYRSRLVTASADSTVKVWNAAVPAGGMDVDEDDAPSPLLATLAGHEGGVVNALGFNEATAVTGGDDCTARSWDMTTATQVHLMRSTARVTSVKFDDARIMVGSSNGQCKVWEQKTGVAVRTVSGHTAPVTDVWADDKDLYTCAADGVRIWDVGSGRLRASLTTPATCFHVNLKEVVTAGADGSVRLWNANTGAQVAQMEHSRWQVINALACDGHRIASASADGSVAIWDYASRVRVHTLAEHRGAVHGVQFDDKKIVTAGADNSIKVWNASSGARMYTLLGGSLQRRANNPEHPTRPGISGVAFDESRIVASINSLCRVYDFDVVSARSAAPADGQGH